MVKIVGVDKGSRAERAGLVDGDVLISINGREINDVLDYRFFLAERSIELKYSRAGAEYSAIIKNSNMTISVLILKLH